MRESSACATWTHREKNRTLKKITVRKRGGQGQGKQSIVRRRFSLASLRETPCTTNSKRSKFWFKVSHTTYNRLELAASQRVHCQIGKSRIKSSTCCQTESTHLGTSPPSSLCSRRTDKSIINKDFLIMGEGYPI